MCHRVTCQTCHKATYRGCGMHVAQVLAGVAQSQRCTCDRARKTRSGGLLAWLRRRQAVPDATASGPPPGSRSR